MKVHKAVILAAGFGTRMLPATKVVPKELLPLVDRPAIEYVVEELLESGIEHLIIVTSTGKRAVEDHFGRVSELEDLLEAKDDQDRLDRVRRTWQIADIAFVHQHHMGGIAHAARTARRAIGPEPFVLVLPDDVIVAEPPATRQLLKVFDEYQASVVCVERIPRARSVAYGVVDVSGTNTNGSGSAYKVAALVEKPQPDVAPSDLGIVGRYVFTPGIFEAIDRTEAGANGELQITDAMTRLIEKEPLYAAEIDGRRYDTGHPMGYIEAGIELALRRPEYKGQLHDYLAGLVESDLFQTAQTASPKGQG
jgi:UTP--glucose-1-phosphate uridylyltransferase